MPGAFLNMAGVLLTVAEAFLLDRHELFLAVISPKEGEQGA